MLTANLNMAQCDKCRKVFYRKMFLKESRDLSDTDTILKIFSICNLLLILPSKCKDSDSKHLGLFLLEMFLFSHVTIQLFLLFILFLKYKFSQMMTEINILHHHFFCKIRTFCKFLMNNINSI